MKSTELILDFVGKYGSEDNREMMKDLKRIRKETAKEVSVPFMKSISNVNLLITNTY